MGRKRNKGQGKSAPVRYEIVRAPKVEQPQKKTPPAGRSTGGKVRFEIKKAKPITIPDKIISKRDGREVPKDEIVIVTSKWHNDDNGGHHHVILESVQDHHVSVGLTTDSKKGKNSTNYNLDTSPFQDRRDSHIHRQAQVRPKKEYTGEKKGIMTKVDHERATVYGQRAKEKWLKEQEKSKKNNDFVPNTHKD